MYRVTTIRYLSDGLRRQRVVSRGPLHPDKQWVERWADYLRRVGHFYEVRVEASASSESSRDLMGLRN